MRGSYKILAEKYSSLQESEKEDILAGLEVMDAKLKRVQAIRDAVVTLIKDLLARPEVYLPADISAPVNWQDILQIVEEEIGWQYFFEDYFGEFLESPSVREIIIARKMRRAIEDNFYNDKKDPYDIDIIKYV